MRIEVVCYGALRDYLPNDAVGNVVVVDVAEGATVGDVVDVLGAPRALAVSNLVGDLRADLDRKLNEGDRVTLMPPFTGG